MPYVIASDLVGEVVALGDGEHSSKFTIGEHVFGHTFAEGGFDNNFNGAQQYALVDARFVGRVAGSGLSNDQASTIPVVVLAAFIALFASSGHGFPPPFSPEADSFQYGNITLLVIGGGSNTGRATIELAKLAGIGRIIAVAGLHNEARLKSVGATHVIDRQAPDVLDQVRAITGDELVHAVDTVNAGLGQELGVAALSNTKKGSLVTLRRTEGEFDPARIGPKSAGFEVIKGLDSDAVNKALDQYRDGKGSKVNIHPWE
ncbi:alcohol zinc-binding dehydrogenase [Colletotrichum tofieldiae]|nr:alcohol zinc-binding dehydrogenase [Colletotrichum tofieldiae]